MNPDPPITVKGPSERVEWDAAVLLDFSGALLNAGVEALVSTDPEVWEPVITIEHGPEHGDAAVTVATLKVITVPGAGGTITLRPATATPQHIAALLPGERNASLVLAARDHLPNRAEVLVQPGDTPAGDEYRLVTAIESGKYEGETIIHYKSDGDVPGRIVLGAGDTATLRPVDTAEPTEPAPAEDPTGGDPTDGDFFDVDFDWPRLPSAARIIIRVIASVAALIIIMAGLIALLVTIAPRRSGSPPVERFVRVITDPVHRYIETHSAGLPVHPGSLFALWILACLTILILSTVGSRGARLAGWPAAGVVTTAAVCAGTPGPARWTATGVAVLTWGVLSMLAYSRGDVAAAVPSGRDRRRKSATRRLRRQMADLRIELAKLRNITPAGQSPQTGPRETVEEQRPERVEDRGLVVRFTVTPDTEDDDPRTYEVWRSNARTARMLARYRTSEPSYLHELYDVRRDGDPNTVIDTFVVRADRVASVEVRHAWMPIT